MGKKIILVEDDNDLAQLLILALNSNNYEVERFENGKAALKYIAESQNLDAISLIILDRMLPDMDGIEILKKIKVMKKSGVPVLILSALSAEGDVIGGLKLGAVDYITKPFNLKILMEKVSLLISKEQK